MAKKPPGKRPAKPKTPKAIPKAQAVIPLQPLTPSPTTAFKRDVEQLKKRQWDMERFKGVIETLCSGGPLPDSYNDHPLKGKWVGWRDCHVSGDWVIIYRKTGTEVELARTGTHSDLFK